MPGLSHDCDWSPPTGRPSSAAWHGILSMTCLDERRFSSALEGKPTLGRYEGGARPVVSPEEQKVHIDDVGKDRHSLWDFLG